MGLTSYSWITFGCLTFFRIFISREILSISFFSLILAFSRILIATYVVNYMNYLKDNLQVLGSVSE